MTNSIILLTDLAAEASGYTISVVSILVVFLSLTVLVLIFTAIPKLLEMKIKSNIKNGCDGSHPECQHGGRHQRRHSYGTAHVL